MTLLPDPVWPVIVLAIISFIDGLLCIKPVEFIAQCFEDVYFPRRWWWITPPIKFAATAGLILGIWIPGLAALTAACLIVYFVLAIAMHIRAHDFGRNLFVNATGMLVICLATATFCFLV
ncbi:DoxX family protein [Brevibacterium daeguense]|uniref:DoxX family protein n=1 Tax=Brevibacterium daeguense TaxID=909936 RepID=A0ABP8EHF5_9MICO|nr:DoxX family protein [Brevibacterium daeguense]